MGAFATINVLESVLDTIKLRLGNLVQNCPWQSIDNLLKVTSELEDVLFSTIAKCMIKYPRDAERLARLVLRRADINEFKKKIQNIRMTGHQKVNENAENIFKPKHAWLGWQHNPTLDWLMSGSWHHVHGLRASYGSSDEYAESLLKLWTLLTFYWGSGAVWPRCAHKQNDKDVAAAGSDINACDDLFHLAPECGVLERHQVSPFAKR